MKSSTEERLENERQFHNERFSEETRTRVIGFYKTIQNCFADYQELVSHSAQGNTILEYGCAKGENALRLADRCHQFHGIDISDVAIDVARKRALNSGLKNCSFEVMNAEKLEFDDSTFDLVFGSGILHHLDLNKAYSELARVMKPGGAAVFVEPLGHNKLINAYRNKTPDIRTPDEHPLTKRDFKLAENYFAKVDVKLYGLATLGAIPVINSRVAKPIITMGKFADRILLRIPGIKWWSWFSLIKFSRY